MTTTVGRDGDRAGTTTMMTTTTGRDGVVPHAVDRAMTTMTMMTMTVPDAARAARATMTVLHAVDRATTMTTTIASDPLPERNAGTMKGTTKMRTPTHARRRLRS